MPRFGQKREKEVFRREEAPAVSQEETAKLAYELYLKRGGNPGNDWADWFEAEAQLKKNR